MLLRGGRPASLPRAVARCAWGCLVTLLCLARSVHAARLAGSQDAAERPAHVAHAWARAPVVPGRLCPAGSVIGEYARRHKMVTPPTDFGNGGGSGTAWMQRNWEPHMRCIGEERLGPAGDGGKHVCDPECLLERKDCLVYSFGSNNDFGFESAILPFGCEIHVFDHTGARHFVRCPNRLR
jgi:hypothetical protein